MKLHLLNQMIAMSPTRSTSMCDALLSPNLRHAIETAFIRSNAIIEPTSQIISGQTVCLSEPRRLVQAGAEIQTQNRAVTLPGGSDYFLGPTDNIICPDTGWGLDFESEIAIITDDVPMGCSVSEAPGHIKLVMLCNDISLRLIMKPELAKGFGFYQSKPASAFSPVCVTLDELGDRWDTAKINLPLRTMYNGKTFGNVHAGKDLNFDFAQLIAHAAKTRELRAGTIIGSGTVSNTNYSEVGSSCLAEKRMIETLETGQPITRFMEPGDTIRIEMIDDEGRSIFGAIDQTVTSA